MRLPLIFLAIVTVSALAAACGGGSNATATPSPSPSPSPTPAVHHIIGQLGLLTTSLGLLSTNVTSAGSAGSGGCKGASGYDDIAEGASITAKDQAGTIVGATTLGPGEIAGTTNACSFQFAMDVTPATFYTFAIGHRGGPTYSTADLDGKGWMVSLTLGP